MKNILKYLLLIVLVGGFIACQKDLEIGDAGSVTLSGDWTVTEYNLDGEALYGPYELQVYNTASDPNSIWIENIYDSGYKVKVNKLSETTFAGTGVTDVSGGHEGTIDILEAQVFNEDSIAFRVILYDAAGEVVDDYREAGHRYTGWQDDH